MDGKQLTEHIATVTDNFNVQHALWHYLKTLEYHPGDFKSATEAASDFIDTEADLDELERCLKVCGGERCQGQYTLRVMTSG